MNRKHFIAALILLATAAISVAAQQSGTRPAAPQTAAVPDAKIAFIYSDDFRDEKTGIARYTTILNALKAEFAPKEKELSDIAARMQQLQDEITKLQTGGAPVAQSQIQGKADQLEQLKKEYQRKGEDGQASYKKRHDEVMDPLNRAIATALDAYAKSHGINILIDGSQVPVLYLADGIDITRPFINEFNSKNPGTPARP